MKISKSKQELARIISENGGWINAAGFAAQDKNAVVTFFVDKPWRCDAVWECENFEAVGGFGVTEEALKNWHQTILSREEYFNLYPEPEADVNITVENNTSLTVTVSGKPTIEQLAADYRNAKDYADRKQQEADDAKADADAGLAKLVAAGKALGLIPASAVKPAIDGCMQLVDMVPTRLQSHQEESVAAIGYVVNVERLYDKVRYAFDLLK